MKTNLSPAGREEAYPVQVSFSPVANWPLHEEVRSFFEGSIHFNVADAVLGFLDTVVKTGAHKPQWEWGIWVSRVVRNI